MLKFIACELRNMKHFMKRVLPTIVICVLLIWGFNMVREKMLEQNISNETGSIHSSLRVWV